MLDADGFAREGAVVLQSVICQTFPEACNAEKLDRAALGRIVFADPEARKRLEAILHPYVRGRMAEETAKAEDEGGAMVVQDIPLLFETGQENRFDGVLLVVAPTELRQERVMTRSGLSEAEFLSRDQSQMPQEEKIKRATWVIENDGSLEQLRERVVQWLEDRR